MLNCVCWMEKNLGTWGKGYHKCPSVWYKLSYAYVTVESALYMSLSLLNIAQSIQKCNRRLPNIWAPSSFRPSESSRRMRRWSVSVTWHAHDHIVCIVCLALLHTWYVLTHAWNEIGVEIRGRDRLQFACLLRNSVVSLCILLSQWMVTDVRTCVAEWLPARNRLCLQLGILTCIYCMRERYSTAAG